jgi:hypothetical protein
VNEQNGGEEQAEERPTGKIHRGSAKSDLGRSPSRVESI